MDASIVVILALLCVLVVVNIFISVRKRNETNISPRLENRLASMESSFEKFDPMIRSEFVRNREENNRAARENREEQSIQQEKMRQAIDLQLKEIRAENEKKLEEMRKTVDENLKETVEKRFNESFKLISERLEQVHKGLGEMKQLASGVDDLRKVLINVKTKGNLGEIQLGSILEQIMSFNQFEAQKAVKEGSQERVDYVIKLPDKNSSDRTLLLPIDSKFPTEDYQRLLDAIEARIPDNEMRSVSNSFEASVKKCAKDIHDKYINPPVTTDFAIMFVPTEGLYAEIVRRTELFETLQRSFKVTVVGPTNLAAFLSSLQMGFRTLAIERRSNEVWEILGVVKTEFRKFGDVVDNIKKKIDSAAKEIDSVGTRTRAIERSLKSVSETQSEKQPLITGYISDDPAD
ncbi:RmuC family protein [Candidatus Methanoplasma termitum]|uniref:RmuC family protein n=1 Tax=Candidatus Methanoplasma termitum TaxID=1577791 RepID=A0A0A7LBM7_9ARCH|nr:DNA recombination protein RmuC [Candidatus Methanoplasma termitum]AIZ56550.1 RmuC family protein [Candidatus Methanoplasma termitum]MCL2333183.1 DNA recombination protein RmuC [Candidatus Methanoplasma sp.]